MSLIEHDALRMARGLDDYELLTVTDVGGSDQSGYWIRVRDERFGDLFELSSHFDYWDFLGSFAAGTRWASKPCSDPTEGSQRAGMHTSRVLDPPGRHEGDENRFDIECDRCGWIAAAESTEHAAAIARLHDAFVAVLVDRWAVA